MLRLLVLLGLAAFCAASSGTGRQYCCSAEDRHIVQKQWGILWHDTESSKVKIGFGRLILTKLAKENPEVATLFEKVDIANPLKGIFSAHCLRILNALDLAINLMDDPDALDAALDHLADQHQARPGVKKAHFVKIGEILHEGLPKVLDDYNSMSWKSCFKGILGKIASKLNA